MSLPRYAPQRAFPAYRHRLGRTPHPRTDPAGHSHGLPEPSSPALTPSTWRVHEAWRFGADLFNAGFWWEAHEQWEAAWRATPDGDTRHLLQGLIQVGAALLQADAGNARGCRRLWRRARAHLLAVAVGAPVMGLDMTSLQGRLEEAFAAWDAQWDGAPGAAYAGSGALPPPPAVALLLIDG